MLIILVAVLYTSVVYGSLNTNASSASCLCFHLLKSTSSQFAVVFICLPSCSSPISRIPLPGVYVEKVGDGSGEGPYVGLLGIGDEILQVNGEAVAGLSLDQVTRLMTRESTTSLRIVPARRNQR